MDVKITIKVMVFNANTRTLKHSKEACPSRNFCITGSYLSGLLKRLEVKKFMNEIERKKKDFLRKNLLSGLKILRERVK